MVRQAPAKHPSSLGVEVRDRKLYYIAASQSIRILLCHYRQCCDSAAAWTTCQKTYINPIGIPKVKGRKSEDLVAVSAIFDVITLDPQHKDEAAKMMKAQSQKEEKEAKKKKTKNDSVAATEYDWESIGACAPSATFWEVAHACMHACYQVCVRRAMSSWVI